MDAVKKQRRSLRAAFTRAYNAFEAEVRMGSREEKLVAFQLLEARMAELNTVHAEHFKLLFASEATEEQIAKDLESDDEYRTTYLKAKLSIEGTAETTLDRAPSVTDQPTSVMRKTLKLPAIELPKFNGNIKDWLSFWSVFRKIHEDPTIRKEDKFQYLVQATAPDSRAQDLVKSFPPTADNYDSVITSLKNRFGRDDMVVEFYVRELLGLVLQNAVKGNQKLTLTKIHDKLESYIRALGSLGVTTDKCASMLYPLVESSLPEEVLRAWQRSGQRETIEAGAQRATKDRLARLLEFLQAEVENQERIDMALQGFGFSGESDKAKKTKGKTEITNVASASALLTVNKEKRIDCIFCKGSHDSSECEHARKLDLSERRACVRDSNVCYICIKRGHLSRNCRSKVRCVWCGRRHVLILCPGLASKNDVELKKVEKNKDFENNLATFCQSPEVCMQTLRVTMYSDSGEKVVRVIIDSASQRSYMRADIAKELGYVSNGDVEITHSLFGGVKSKIKKHDMFLARMKNLDGSYACNFSVLSQDTICDTVPCVKKEAWLKELRNRDIILSDIGGDQSSIDVLIGADVAGKLLTGKKYDLNNGLIAFETLLGWTIMGKMPGEQNERSNPVAMFTSMFAREADLTDLWRLDVLGINDPIEKSDKLEQQENVKQFIRNTINMNADKRYEVRLPWKNDHIPLPDNLGLAKRRLKGTIEKLKKEDFLLEYGNVFKSWLMEGIIEKVPDKELTRECHYLPHRPVIKLSSTTKIRPVFDASAYKRGYPSLNQCLEVGPNMIELVPDILNRFREREIGVISDIRGAFLQIAVDARDRDFLRFLWQDNGEEIVYRHCRVVFGLTCSPFLLAATIESLLNTVLIKAQQSDGSLWSEDSVRKLSHSFYVDNCVASVDSSEELDRFICEATEIMAKGGFDLRLWEHSGDTSENESTLVLGVSWNKRRDSISINPTSIVMQIPQMVTKRTILSVAHKVFDPIGFTCPVTLQPKILLSQLWAEKVDWDSSIEGKRKHEFLEWIKDLHLLRQIELTRKLSKGKLTIHAFGDASGAAYASVVFARVETESAIEVQLISARARIAPKETTIPRLELMAASITARLTDSVIKSFTRQVDGVFYWSDSTTALSWLRRENGNWGTFVYNRVREIRKISDVNDWRFVPGELNPADLPSRGCSPSQLVESEWWLGPDWLKKAETDWPLVVENVNENEVKSEVKKSVIQMLNREITEFKASAIFSSYTRLLRFMAWMRRFLSNRRLIIEKRRNEQGNNPSNKNKIVYLTEEMRKKLCLSYNEIKEAEISLLRNLQSTMFKNSGKDKLSSFKTWKNEDGLYVLRTKILNRDDNSMFLNPILLDKHDIVNLLVRETHERSGHSGVPIVITTLREKFWIMSVRQVARSVIAKCVVCQKQKVKRLECDPPPLPANRVRDAAIFEVTGVDFAGPVYIRGGEKRWICIFTCAVYRAVHLELVSSLSVDGFILCLRRFIARRGRPEYMYSDNGTNFVGTVNALDGLDWTKIMKSTATLKIRWYFSPPSAPWWGGWWERLIGVLKSILRKILGKAALSHEEMVTSLCDAEAIINSRPLTYVTEDPENLKPISPAMFLQEIREVGTADLDMLYTEKLGKKVKYRQKIFTDLRTRFRSEYLSHLLLKKGKKETRQIKVDDVVLIGDQNHRRIDWPLARVVEVIRGRDDKIRVCILKTKNGLIKRPIQRLYPLEIPQDNSEMNDFYRTNENKTVKINVDNDRNSKLKNKRNKSNSIVKEVLDDSDLESRNENVTTRSGRVSRKPQRIMY